MTTTVIIAISGNKAVKIKGPHADYILQPGGHWSLGIHGEQSLSIAEDGNFITPPQLVATLTKKPVDLTERAQALWAAYSASAGGVTFDGKPLPTWAELGDDRQRCWIAVAAVPAA